jgi:hypothetical protein
MNLVDDLVPVIAAFLGNPRDVLKMALLCPLWHGLLERHRTSVLAETFGVPAARCDGSTSLANALGLWHDYLYVWREYPLPVKPGTTTPLQVQLVLLPSARQVDPEKFITRSASPGTYMFKATDHARYYPVERSYLLADGLSQHALLFEDSLVEGLSDMWQGNWNLHATGTCLYHVFASPSQMIPMELFAIMYNVQYSKKLFSWSCWHHFTSPIFQRIFQNMFLNFRGDEFPPWVAPFLERFADFWGHKLMRPYILAAFEGLGAVEAQLFSMRGISDCPDIKTAWEKCKGIFPRTRILYAEIHGLVIFEHH